VTDYVVDTNIWVMIDKPLDKLSLEEITCLKACRKWLKDFVKSEQKLVVDLSYKIIGEYRVNIPKGGLARQWLNQLETQPREVRLIEVEIELDDKGVAVLPKTLVIADKNDRKFVAVALAVDPHPSIVNATDTDWLGVQKGLEEHNIIVINLCLDYLVTIAKKKAK